MNQEFEGIFKGYSSCLLLELLLSHAKQLAVHITIWRCSENLYEKIPLEWERGHNHSKTDLYSDRLRQKDFDDFLEKNKNKLPVYHINKRVCKAC
jgi:hypothetical protein